MDTLVTVHSWVRWLVLLALVTGTVIGALRHRRRAAWDTGIYQFGVMTLDIQVAIGVVIWIVDDAWSETFFFKVIHPGFMLTALVVAHVGLVVARHRNDLASHLIGAGSFFVAFGLITAAIPWDRL